MPPDSQKYAGKKGSDSISSSRTLSVLNACRQSNLTPLDGDSLAAPATTDPENRSRHGDRTSYAVHVYRKEAHSQELCEARQRPAGAVPAGDAIVIVSRIPAGVDARNGAQERGPAGRVHVDLPDLEPLGQRPARVRQLFAA